MIHRFQQRCMIWSCLNLVRLNSVYRKHEIYICIFHYFSILMTQVIEIAPHGSQRSIRHARSIFKELGNQQPWYWHSYFRIFMFQHEKVLKCLGIFATRTCHLLYKSDISAIFLAVFQNLSIKQSQISPYSIPTWNIYNFACCQLIIGHIEQ